MPNRLASTLITVAALLGCTSDCEERLGAHTDVPTEVRAIVDRCAREAGAELTDEQLESLTATIVFDGAQTRADAEGAARHVLRRPTLEDLRQLVDGFIELNDLGLNGEVRDALVTEVAAKEPAHMLQAGVALGEVWREATRLFDDEGRPIGPVIVEDHNEH